MAGSALAASAFGVGIGARLGAGAASVVGVATGATNFQSCPNSSKSTDPSPSVSNFFSIAARYESSHAKPMSTIMAWISGPSSLPVLSLSKRSNRARSTFGGAAATVFFTGSAFAWAGSAFGAASALPPFGAGFFSSVAFFVADAASASALVFAATASVALSSAAFLALAAAASAAVLSSAASFLAAASLSAFAAAACSAAAFFASAAFCAAPASTLAFTAAASASAACVFVSVGVATGVTNFQSCSNSSKSTDPSPFWSNFFSIVSK